MPCSPGRPCGHYPWGSRAPGDLGATITSSPTGLLISQQGVALTWHPSSRPGHCAPSQAPASPFPQV